MTTIDLSEHLKLVNTEDGKYKGLIFDHSDQLVVSNFPVIEEIVIENTDSKDSNDSETEYFEFIEGSILRVYYFKDEWHISTNGRLDAFTSFWANPESFGKQFENLICTLTREQLDFDEFCCGLDQEYNYFFLLPTFENNRLGVLEDRMKFYLVGLEHTEDHTLLSGSSLPSYTRGFTNHQLWSYPARITKEQAFQEGAIVFSSITGVMTKLMTPEYKSNMDLRNNEPNLYKRYLELLCLDPIKAEQLKNMHKQVNFDYVINQAIQDLILYTYRCYVHRFIYKEQIKVSQVIHFFLGLCLARSYRYRYRCRYFFQLRFAP